MCCVSQFNKNESVIDYAAVYASWELQEWQLRKLALYHQEAKCDRELLYVDQQWCLLQELLVSVKNNVREMVKQEIDYAKNVRQTMTRNQMILDVCSILLLIACDQAMLDRISNKNSLNVVLLRLTEALLLNFYTTKFRLDGTVLWKVVALFVPWIVIFKIAMT